MILDKQILHNSHTDTVTAQEHTLPAVPSFVFENPRHFASFFQVFVGAVFVVLALLLTSSPCLAQAMSSATNVDIGGPGVAGTFTYNGTPTPPTYTVTGSGSSYFIQNEQFAFTNVPTTGNVELKARLSSQSTTNTNGRAGLMIREAYTTTPFDAAIMVESTGQINFYYRYQLNGWNQVVNGPTETLPVYLKLTKNNQTISGYYSTDNQNWTLVGSNTTTNWFPNLFYAGLAVTNGSNTTSNTAVFDYLSYITDVPQTSSNLLLWLRSDLGVTSTAGAVSQWSDQSGNSNNATQSTGTLQPSLVTGAINNGVVPTISFNGTSQYLSLPSGFANFTAGASIFTVIKPSSSTATGDQCSLGNAANSDAVFCQQVGTQASFSAYNGSTSSSVTTTTNPLTTSSYQLLETTLLPGATSGTATGTIFVNGTQKVQSTTMQNLTNTTRSSNFIAAGVGPGNYFGGGIAEVLIFNTILSASQRTAVESYILSKFGVGTQPTLDNPVFVPGGGLYPPGQTVTFTQDQNGVIYFTTDGTTPSTSSQWFSTTPITLLSGETIKAIANAPFFNNSAVVSATFDIDPLSMPVTHNGMVLWLRSDKHVTSSGGTVSEWDDISGSANNATQSISGDRPTLTANAINGLPAVTFASGKFMQIPAGMANFTSGASIFAVVRPTSVVANARILDFGNGSASNNIILDEPASTSNAMLVYNVASSSNVTAASSVTVNNYQLLEAVHNGAGTATLFTNGVQTASGTINNINNILRSNNMIGQASGGGTNFAGQLAELMVFNRGVTSLERAQIEGYLFSRYQLFGVNSTTAPKLSLPTATYTAPIQVAIEAQAEATIRFTVDGTTPTTSSPIYTGPFNVNFTQTVKAIAVVNGIASSATSATYTLDSTEFPAPSTASTPLQLDLQLPQLPIPQDSNQH